MRLLKINLVILVLIALTTFGVTRYMAHRNAAPVAPEKQVTDDFNFKKLNGERGHLYRYKGQKVVLHFWASWCAPCVEELPELFAKAKLEKQTQFILITLDKTPGEAVNFLDKYEVDSNIVFGIDDGALSKTFNLAGLPESFIFNPDLTVKRHMVGSVHWESLAF